MMDNKNVGALGLLSSFILYVYFAYSVVEVYFSPATFWEKIAMFLVHLVLFMILASIVTHVLSIVNYAFGRQNV